MQPEFDGAFRARRLVSSLRGKLKGEELLGKSLCYQRRTSVRRVERESLVKKNMSRLLRFWLGAMILAMVGLVVQ